MDFKWTSLGGVLLDGNGDIAIGTPQDSVLDMIRTRLKAAADGWKLYRIGADLVSRIGDTVGPELETSITRQVQSVLQDQLLRPGSFSVKVVSLVDAMRIYVYLQQSLVATVQANKDGSLQVS